MANFVSENQETLRSRHYLLLANQKKHWFNAYPGVVSYYEGLYGDNFCIVLWRNGSKDDAYVIPYARLKTLFTDANLTSGPKKTKRWHGVVKGGVLTLHRDRGEPVPVEEFHNAFGLLTAGVETAPAPTTVQSAVEVAEITLGLERDLQRGLRLNIAQLETGLAILDGGSERSTDAGRIDITARDSTGRTVVIELKAGTAMPEALTQLLAYVAATTETEGRRARGILVAGDFHPRLVRAASMVEDIQLLRYRTSFAFERVSGSAKAS